VAIWKSGDESGDKMDMASARAGANACLPVPAYERTLVS